MNEIAAYRGNKILILLLVLMPIINQYQFLPLTCWELYAVTVVILGLLRTRGKLYIFMDKSYVFFCAFICVTFLMSIIYYHNLGLITALLRLIKFVIVSIAVVSMIPMYTRDIDSIKRCYRSVLFWVSAVLIVQLVVYYGAGRQIYPLLPNTTLNYNDGVNSSELINTWIAQINGGYYFRPSSVFIEPAHYALFALPGIVFELFADSINKKNVALAAFFTISAVLTTSSMALLGCGICWGLFVIKRKDLWKSKSLWMLSLVAAGMPIVIYYLVNNSAVLTTISIKLAGLNNLSESSSVSLRLVRGLQYFSNEGFVQKIFGVGYGNLTEYYLNSNMSIIGSGKIGQVSYMNGFSTILCSFGVIGVSVFLFYLYRVYKKSNMTGKAMLVCFCAAMLGCDIFDSAIYYIFLLIATILLHENSHNFDGLAEN